MFLRTWFSLHAVEIQPGISPESTESRHKRACACHGLLKKATHVILNVPGIKTPPVSVPGRAHPLPRLSLWTNMLMSHRSICSPSLFPLSSKPIYLPVHFHLLYPRVPQILQLQNQTNYFPSKTTLLFSFLSSWLVFSIIYVLFLLFPTSKQSLSPAKPICPNCVQFPPLLTLVISFVIWWQSSPCSKPYPMA